MSLPEQSNPVSRTSSGQSAAAGGSLLATLRRRALVIVVTTLLVGGAAAAAAYLLGGTYQTTAELLFSQTINTQLNALGLIPPTPNPDKLAADNQALVGSRRVAMLTVQKLHDGTSVDSVQKDVSVPLPKTSDVVDIVASGGSAQRAANLANAYASAAVQLAQQDQTRQTDAIVGALRAQLKRLGRRDPATIGIRARIATVVAAGTAGIAGPQLIQAGHAPTTKSGKPLATVLLGTLFGLLLGIGLALLREQTDPRLRHAEEVSAAFDAPVLTTIPRNRALGQRVPLSELPPAVAESFQMLQANLRYGHSEPVRSVLVTSSRSDQGKTTVAWNLAVAAASTGIPVALVDADLRRSSIASRYELLPFPGLAEVLRGVVSDESAIQSVRLSPEPGSQNGHGAQNGHGPTLSVLVAGAAPPDPSALLQSPRLPELLRSLGQRYSLVIVDTPPIAQVSDAIPLLRLVDGVLVVASTNSTRGPEAENLRGQLQALDARVLGAVLNGGTRADGPVYASNQALTS